MRPIQKRCLLVLLASSGLFLLSCHQKDNEPSKKGRESDTPSATSALGKTSPDEAEEGLQFSAGSIAPNFQLKTLSGELKSLEDFHGRVVLLNFWATWCVPCVTEMPSLERLYKSLQAQGLEIVAVSGDQEASEVEKFAKENGLTFPILLDPDGKTFAPFGLSGFPESFFVDGDGKFLSFSDPETKENLVRIISDRPWDSASYISSIKQLLEKK